MKSKNKELNSILQKIKIVLTDVDGVLTDCGMYYTETGLWMKKFNVRDGMGSSLLRKAGYKVGIITTDKTDIAKVRGEWLNLDYIFYGINDKKKILEQICLQERVDFENVSFIGDDVNDLTILESVGFSAAPKDAMTEIKDIVNYVCTKKGGDGAFREYANLILSAKN